MGRILSRISSNSISRTKYGKWRSSSHSRLQEKQKKLSSPRSKNLHQRDNTRKDLSKLRCYTYDERGHFAKDYPRNNINSHNKKGNKRRHHAHAVEDDEPSSKRTRYESEDSSSEDEYVLISSLMGNITNGSDDWLIDSGASKHMTGFKESFVRLSEHESPHKVN